MTICVGLLFTLCACWAGTIELKITGIRHKNGKLLIALFAGKKGFPGDRKAAVQTKILPITNLTMTVTFPAVSTGTYAIAVCHDENDDGHMNATRLMRPAEGFGTSLNEKPKWIPPSYKKAKFEMGTHDLETTIEMVYLK